VLIFGQLAIDPFGARSGTDEHEQPADRFHGHLLAGVIAYLDPFQVVIPDKGNDLCPGRELDPGVTFYLVD
jgi:hypothetical protein